MRQNTASRLLSLWVLTPLKNSSLFPTIGHGRSNELGCGANWKKQPVLKTRISLECFFLNGLAFLRRIEKSQFIRVSQDLCPYPYFLTTQFKNSENIQWHASSRTFCKISRSCDLFSSVANLPFFFIQASLKKHIEKLPQGEDFSDDSEDDESNG